MLGPFAPYGHGSVLPAMEVIARNIAMTLEKFQTQNIKSLVPKKEAVADFREHRNLYMKKTVWDDPCSAWFKLGPQGETVLMWPGSRLHCFDVLLHPRWEVRGFLACALIHFKNFPFLISLELWQDLAHAS